MFIWHKLYFVVRKISCLWRNGVIQVLLNTEIPIQAATFALKPLLVFQQLERLSTFSPQINKSEKQHSAPFTLEDSWS